MDMSAEIPRAQSVLAQAPEQSHGGPVAPILSHNAPIPPLPSPNHVLVRVLAVALNPTDYKMPAHFPMPDSTMGCDFCGIVVSHPERSPPELTGDKPAEASAPLPPLGTRVCGAVYAYNPEDPLTGAFAQYVVADARLLLRVPADWSDLRAAALGGIGWGTAGLALWGSDALSLEGRPTRPLDANNANKTPVLVYGGATATGTMACQLLKLSGYVPIAVTSKTSAPLATSFGAATTVAYTSPTCTAAIKDFIATGNKPSQQLQPLRHALDCITDPESAAVCFGALGRTGGRYACLEAFDEAWRSRRAVRVEVIMAYELWGARVILDDGVNGHTNGNGNAHADNGVAVSQKNESGSRKEKEQVAQKNSPAAIYSRPANPGKLRATIAWASEMQNLLDNGLIENHPVCELDGKWDGIMKGLGMLRHGKVRGCKLVVRISEA